MRDTKQELLGGSLGERCLKGKGMRIFENMKDVKIRKLAIQTLPHKSSEDLDSFFSYCDRKPLEDTRLGVRQFLEMNEETGERHEFEAETQGG